MDTESAVSTGLGGGGGSVDVVVVVMVIVMVMSVSLSVSLVPSIGAVSAAAKRAREAEREWRENHRSDSLQFAEAKI